MTAIQMPEPVAYMSEQGKESLRQFGQSSVISGSARSTYTEFIHGLITSDQAEAYATAKVRETLERAIVICVAAYEQGKSEYRVSGYNPYFEGGCDVSESIETKIRALIPKEPT